MMFVAVFVLVAISVKGAVVDTLDVYSEAMKKNVQVVVVSPDNNRAPKPVVCTVVDITRNYFARRVRGEDIEPMWSAFEEYQKEEEAEAAAEEAKPDKAANK